MKYLAALLLFVSTSVVAEECTVGSIEGPIQFGVNMIGFSFESGIQYKVIELCTDDDGKRFIRTSFVKPEEL